MTTRTFTDRPAKRESVPLLIGLFGPSGSGKTYSALRLATGMQRITDGEIYVIDTESRRSLHYSDEFSFQHVQFDAPFSPNDYLSAIDHCVKKKAKIIIVDSMSHEHEGPGGVLEWHDAEMDRMAGGDWKKRERVTFAAWIKPKQARRRLINTVLQLGVSAIFCFRAKEKMRIKKGEDPMLLGWMPIAGDEYLYEMTLNCLLYPNSGGSPTWMTSELGEKMMLKLPRHFEPIFKDRQPLSEDIGQALAEWARGDEVKKPTDESDDPMRIAGVLAEISHAPDIKTLGEVAAKHRSGGWSDKERADIKDAINLRKSELTSA